MNIKLIFHRLGLSKHTPIIYETLQAEGPLLVAEIARLAKIHRPAVYAALHDLLQNRFVLSVTEGRRTRYQVTNSSRIAQEFSGISIEAAKAIAKILPDKEPQHHEKIHFLSGKDGIRAAFDDAVNYTPRGGTFYRYTSERNLDTVNAYLSKDYRERRDKKKLERLVISNHQSGSRKRSRLERFIKYMPPTYGTFDQNIIQLVYSDRLSFIDLNTEQCIIIENKALAEFQKTIFQQLYRRLDG